MKYPPFNLEKALQGELIAVPINKTTVVKGYLRQSSLDEGDLRRSYDSLRYRRISSPC